MADNRSVTITLKTVQSGGQEEQINTAKQTSISTESQENDSNSSAKALATFAAVQVLSNAVNEAVAWGEYYWNRELTLNDDYIGQRNKRIAATQINRVISAASNITSATASGAAIGGPIGAAIGFLIGAGTQIAGIIRSNVQGQDQQNIVLRQMDAQLQFTRSRVGWSTQAASIGEDL